jgi:hypothetical protein
MNKGRMEQLGQLQWKYSDPTRCIRSKVVSATCHLCRLSRAWHFDGGYFVPNLPNLLNISSL